MMRSSQLSAKDQTSTVVSLGIIRRVHQLSGGKGRVLSGGKGRVERLSWGVQLLKVQDLTLLYV